MMDSINGARTDSSTFLKDHHPVGAVCRWRPEPFNTRRPSSLTTSVRPLTPAPAPHSMVGGYRRQWPQKSDLLLFTRTDTQYTQYHHVNSESVGRPYVECASCHDPHNISIQPSCAPPTPAAAGLHVLPCQICPGDTPRHINENLTQSRQSIGEQTPLGAMLAGLALMLALDVATAGVATTKHNLGSTGTAGNNKFGGTTEVCVFCHTPTGPMFYNRPGAVVEPQLYHRHRLHHLCLTGHHHP